MSANFAKQDMGPGIAPTTTFDSEVPPSSQDSDANFEARSYYYGLPSQPFLVYRTGIRSTGPEAYCSAKEIRPVFDHPIADVWDELGPQALDYLDTVNVSWTTIDVVRFAEVGKDSGPPVLWVGVRPGSLSCEDAKTAAVGCEGLLKKFKLTDVEIAFRESIFTRSAAGGPKLLKYDSLQAIAGLHRPLTPALGLQIASRATPYAEGTGALYISKGSDGEKVYILTARHIVFPPRAGFDGLYTRTRIKQLPLEVILPGPEAFQTLLKSTVAKIGSDKTLIDRYNQQLDDLKTRETSGDNDSIAGERVAVEDNLRVAEASFKAFDKFHDETTKYWCAEVQRVIGLVSYSPPITVGTGTKRYAEDWALIELDRNKIDWNDFKGNVIDLGTKISASEFMSKMCPDPADPACFKYPSDRLLPVQGVIEEDELRHPQTRGADGEPCLMVLKHGCNTGVTIGRATGIKSFVREYFTNGTHVTSMEWAILPYDNKSGAFSAPGDSGAIIVNGNGRIGGLLIGGAGQKDFVDVTYASPFYWLLQRIRTHFPDAHLYQAMA